MDEAHVEHGEIQFDCISSFLAVVSKEQVANVSQGKQ